MQGFAVLVARTKTVVMIPHRAGVGCLHGPLLDCH